MDKKKNCLLTAKQNFEFVAKPNKSGLLFDFTIEANSLLSCSVSLQVLDGKREIRIFKLSAKKSVKSKWNVHCFALKKSNIDEHFRILFYKIDVLKLVWNANLPNVTKESFAQIEVDDVPRKIFHFHEKISQFFVSFQDNWRNTNAQI